MKLIQKGNRQLRVDDVRAEELIKAGYVEVDQKTGKPIKVETKEESAMKAVQEKAEELLKENASLKEENKALQEQVADLTEKVKKAEAAAKNAKKPAKAEKAVEPAAPADPDAPKTE